MRVFACLLIALLAGGCKTHRIFQGTLQTPTGIYESTGDGPTSILASCSHDGSASQLVVHASAPKVGHGCLLLE